jgi:hypothetical protein
MSTRLVCITTSPHIQFIFDEIVDGQNQNTKETSAVLMTSALDGTIEASGSCKSQATKIISWASIERETSLNEYVRETRLSAVPSTNIFRGRLGNKL